MHTLSILIVVVNNPSCYLEGELKMPWSSVTVELSKQEQGTEDSMDTNIVLVYCLCDDLLKWQHHRDDPQCVLSDAEIMTIAMVAAMYFGGNQAMSGRAAVRTGLSQENNQPQSPLPSSEASAPQFMTLFHLLGDVAKERNPTTSTSLTVCRLQSVTTTASAAASSIAGGAYRGYQASKKRYFYGLKIHLVVTKEGCRSSSCSPGAFNDAVRTRPVRL